MANMVDIPTKDGETFKAYVAMPAQTPAPVMIVIQEIFGVNKEMRDKCDAYAAQGYIAVCPDLFWRLEPGIELTDQTEEEWEKAFDLFNRFDVDQGVEDLRAALHTFKGHADSTGKVGCVGYCLGGKLAYLMACRSHTTATVGFYGVDINNFVNEAKNINSPLMLHVAEEDEYVSKEAQKEMKDGLGDHNLVTLHSYAGVDHAFARNGGDHFDAKAAEKSNMRTAAFFKEHLAG